FYSLKWGSTGEAVYQLQTALCDMGYLSASADGIFGPITYQAVLDFQTDSGFSVIDGIAGKQTMEALFKSYSPTKNSSENNAPTANNQTIRKGMTGSSVLELQNKLYRNGFLTAKPDGIFGNYTETALKKFQLYNGLAVSGLADQDTLNRVSSNAAVSNKWLQMGSSGEAVMSLQRILQELGYLDAEPDGAFGRLTYRAVAAYQGDHGLTADGIVGAVTTSSLISLPGILEMTGQKTEAEKEPDSSVKEETAVPAIVRDETLLKKGMTGDSVLSLQQALIRNGYLHAEADGIFGNKTEKALKQFEVYNDLSVTGMVDQTLLSKVLSENAVPFSVLSEGSTGVSVKGIQKVLFNLGYLTASPDGIFGRKTKQAIALFQEINDVGSSYGKADQSTANELTDLTDEYEKEMTDLTPQQKNLIRASYLEPTTAPGLCSGWVSNVLASYGISGYDIVSSRDSVYSYAYQNGLTDANYEYDTDFNANDYWAYICTSDKKEDLKPGMVVATRSTYSYLGRQFGHVGFYLGNNKVISSIGYIETADLDEFDEKYNNKEYGSTMRWGFAPTFLSK
ncbi:MAG: peptidoglycan-binding protein, partial [Parasporobacterium sp.]|nr:peptidoglycan-binding protein [Parasporobacterium sp.]